MNIPINVRVPLEQIRQIDDLIHVRQQENGRSVSRAAMVKEFIDLALARHRREVGQ